MFAEILRYLVVVNGASASGTIEVPNDQDLLRVELLAGVNYTFDLQRKAGGLADPFLVLFSPTITQVAFDDDSGGSGNARISYTALTTGSYYLAVVDYGIGTGGYNLRATTADSVAPTLVNRTPSRRRYAGRQRQCRSRAGIQRNGAGR